MPFFHDPSIGDMSCGWPSITTRTQSASEPWRLVYVTSNVIVVSGAASRGLTRGSLRWVDPGLDADAGMLASARTNATASIAEPTTRTYAGPPRRPGRTGRIASTADGDPARGGCGGGRGARYGTGVIHEAGPRPVRGRTRRGCPPVGGPGWEEWVIDPPALAREDVRDADHRLPSAPDRHRPDRAVARRIGGRDARRRRWPARLGADRDADHLAAHARLSAQPGAGRHGRRRLGVRDRRARRVRHPGRRPGDRRAGAPDGAAAQRRDAATRQKAGRPPPGRHVPASARRAVHPRARARALRARGPGRYASARGDPRDRRALGDPWPTWLGADRDAGRAHDAGR